VPEDVKGHAATMRSDPEVDTKVGLPLKSDDEHDVVEGRGNH
jgi:hypothetical protein